MEIKVKEVNVGEEKSVQEVEEKLLNEHEEKVGAEEENQAQTESVQGNEAISDTEQPAEVVQDNVQSDVQAPELTEEDVLSFIKNRYDKEINSIDDLVTEREQEDLPDDIANYMKYRQETGRSFDEYMKLNEDFDSMNQDSLLRQYFKQTQDGLDDEDIDVLLEDYSYDEDIDDESTIKKAKVEKKKKIAEAKKYFNSQKEKYKVPLESSTASIDPQEKEDLEAYKRYIAEAKTIEEESERKRNWFVDKTNEVFNDEFKGFEFKINDNMMQFKPAEASELKKSQLNPQNFIQKYLDDNGMIKDAKGYHKSLAVAMNPERFAKFFYEQGVAAATEDVNKKIKNIDMSERKSPEIVNKNGVQVRSVNPDSGRGLKIRSKSKN
jgi:hypothetical protein